MAAAQGDDGRAAARLSEGLRLSHAIGAADLVAWSLESLAGLAAARGQARRAARLGGAAAALRQEKGAPLPPAERSTHERAVHTVRTALGDEAFATAWAEGQALPREQAVAYALETSAPS
jgi:hypothetical protein